MIDQRRLCLQTTASLFLALFVAQAAQDDAARAKEMIVRGTEAFDQKKFDEAARLFVEAYELLATRNLGIKPELLHNAAVAYDRLGDCERSAPLFERYLELVPKARASADFRKRHARALACAPKIELRTSPDGAQAIVDGRPRGHTPLTLHLKTGEHQVVFELESYQRTEQTITVNKEESFSRTLALAPPPPPVPPPPPIVAPPPPPAEPVAADTSFSPSPWVWVSAGVGVAALVAGIVFGVLAKNEYAVYQSELTKPDACECRTMARSAEDRGRTLSLGANLSYGAAAVGIAVAGVLFFVDP
jgi:hypothetical protein